MATKRGPKVEPKEINKYKVVVNDLPEKPKAQVFEEVSEPVDFTGEDLITNEIPDVELIAEDEFITSEAAKTPHFEFKEEYKLTHNGKDAVIDPLPQPQKRKKTVAELNQSELRLYHKTGFLPEI